MKQKLLDILSERLQNWLATKFDIHEALVDASDINEGSFIDLLGDEILDHLQ